ncbi:hypothetical protein C0Z18_08425 [Trinickia dabaoshanensis]|uniref:2-oxoglutarate dehydrogenase n=1 Tax=Trinickia dabaoshanensis TaxID=564714 RepID=A0A2N7VVZ4_9BURK|nr:hypothetical protein [Trinickia dabaoshanensis]PMS21327.1 hypothetical protein C0Z18_08425 [Trinickia dabaoshanensis]
MSQISLLRLLPRASLAVALVLCAGGALASTLQSVSPPVPLHDGGVDGPFLQRGARASSDTATTGAALKLEAQNRLAASLGENRAFSNNAAITQAQAKANGLGYVAEHFQEIDAARSGKVTLKQVQQYLQQQQ